VTPVKYWQGVTFLRRILTPGSLFYGFIYPQPTRRKVTPVEYWPGVTFLRRIIIVRDHFSPTYTEENDPKTTNSTEKGVTFLRKILTGGSHFYVEKWPRGQYSTEVTSLRYTCRHRVSVHVLIIGCGTLGPLQFDLVSGYRSYEASKNLLKLNLEYFFHKQILLKPLNFT
jgi:hypothetical protein